ncbi:hypothetical protein XH96_03585 [Bradyrhizobium sp. CCBAU 51765]|nr:hypothetical protein XH96_03585 [Bradyrhizobium sp. CCBAU 51765]
MPILGAVDFLASNILSPLSWWVIALRWLALAGGRATEAVGFQRRWLARLWRTSMRNIVPAPITVIFLRSRTII